VITLAELFETYRKRVLPATAPEVQIVECRRAFYAAAHSMLLLLLHTIGDEHVSEDEGVAVLEGLKAECEAFGKAGGVAAPVTPDMNYTVPDPHDMQTTLRDLGDYIGRGLPGGWGFTLLLFEYGENGSLFYISSADRADVIATMREFIKRQTQ
jgi:hypothetical protein